MDESGWTASAAAWIASQGEAGDWGREHVLDPPMLARVGAANPRTALDVGCGEGRFCRLLRGGGIATVGIDPTVPLLESARERDPEGDYREARGESLPFGDGAFDLVIGYLTLIDIPDFRAAIREMARVAAPGGRILVANLNGFATAGDGWLRGEDGERLKWPIDRYLEERVLVSEWEDIRIVNYHRPLSAYMKAFLGEGLGLSYFDEPPPLSGEREKRARARRVPWFVLMEWRKPEP